MCADIVRLCICSSDKPEVRPHTTPARRAARGSRKRDETLENACQWLIAAGFPQYIQLMLEGQLESADIATLSSDHQFINADWLEPAETRLKLLLQRAGVKANSSCSERLKETMTTASACALSRKWKRDRLGRRWRRCRSTPSSTISSPSLSRLPRDPAPPSLPLSGNSPSLSLADPDTGNHVTSGYESETSPTSTTTNARVDNEEDAGRQGCSSAQSGHTGVDSLRSDRSDLENCRRRTSPDSGHSGDLAVLSSVGPQSPRSEEGSTAAGVMRRQRHSVQTSSSTSLPPPRSVSFYDNLCLSEVLADPQSELELILDDLRRNIWALDAALNSPSPSMSSQCLERLDALEGLSVITDDQMSVGTNSTSELLVVSSSAAGSLSPSNVIRGQEPHDASVQSTSPLHSQINSHGDVSRRHRREATSGYDWWLPDVTQRRGRGDGHVTLLTLSASELSLVRQLSLLRVTSLLEKHCERQVSVSIINNLARMLVTSSESDEASGTETKGVFGSSLTSQLRHTGRAVAPCITRALLYINNTAAQTDGLFRRPGVLSRVQKLQEVMNSDYAASAATATASSSSSSSTSTSVEFNAETDVYSLADVIKRYYRELPQSIFTDQLASILVDIFSYVEERHRLKLCRDVLLLLPDAHRTAVYQLLTFLRHVSQMSQHNQMTASNLAVCFLPSLFRVADYTQTTPVNSTRPGAGASQGVNASRGHAPGRSAPGGANPGESATQADGYQLRYKSALTCLATLIANADYLLTLDDDVCRAVDEISQSDTPSLSHQLDDTSAIWRPASEPDTTSVLLHRLFDELLFYVTDQGRSCGWVKESCEWNELSVSRYTDVEHESRLPVWRVSVDVEARPEDVLSRLRSLWTINSTFTRWTTLAQPSDDVDLVEYAVTLPALDRTRYFHAIRSWRYDATSERYFFVSTSVHPQSPSPPPPSPSSGTAAAAAAGDSELEAQLIAGHYVIEPCGVGKTKLTHFSSIDFRGHSDDWYRAAYGRLCALHVVEICRSLQRDADQTYNLAETKL